jgi:hypothetical protein
MIHYAELRAANPSGNSVFRPEMRRNSAKIRLIQMWCPKIRFPTEFFLKFLFIRFAEVV